MLGVVFRVRSWVSRQVGRGTKIDWHADIHPTAVIGEGCEIGRCRIRENVIVGDRVKIGWGAEIKNSVIGSNSSIPHFCYIGDAALEPGVNFSAGAVTANWNGLEHGKTIIRRNSMIGVNVTLIAPIEVPEGTYIAAGSVVTRKSLEGVPPYSLVIANRDKVEVREGVVRKIGGNWIIERLPKR